MILGEPKPSYYPGYVVGGKHYNHEDFRLRGYKQYWLKEVEATDDNGKPRAATTIRPLPRGTEFSGTIRYKNLTEAELGLLLWCLRLEKGCYQSVGMAKPYGYGRMRLTIDAIKEFEAPALYDSGSFLVSDTKSDAAGVEEYIKKYCDYAEQHLADLAPIKENSPLRDFFFMKTSIRTPNEMCYMSLKEYRFKAALPSVQDYSRA